MPGTDGKSVYEFVKEKVNNVNGFVVIHDGLRSNLMKQVIKAWNLKGATTLKTPPSACALSSVETVFAIIKARFRKYLAINPPLVT